MKVLVKHENRHESTAVSYLQYVEVNFGGHTVKLDKGKFVTVIIFVVGLFILIGSSFV